jgi:integration host factor subunit alpha
MTNTDQVDHRQWHDIRLISLKQNVSMGCIQVMKSEVNKSKNVTRAELTTVVYQYSKTSRNEAAQIVDAVFEEITNALAVGHTVKLQNFGSFIPYSKNERIGRNPKTGEAHLIRPRTAVRFKPSHTLRFKVAST